MPTSSADIMVYLIHSLYDSIQKETFAMKNVRNFHGDACTAKIFFIKTFLMPMVNFPYSQDYEFFLKAK